MFDTRIEIIEPGHIIRYEVLADDSPLSFGNVIDLWKTDNAFRTFYSQLLASSPFSAFRWETPSLTTATSVKPFEFVLLNSPEFCSRAPDPQAFASYFTDDDSDFGIVKFDNLGGDSTMIVPSPRGSEKVYGHFADFVRGAPPSQVDTVWRVIGRLLSSELSSKPIWINTAGGGVAWLHVRVDSRPKYYGYKPYQKTA